MTVVKMNRDASGKGYTAKRNREAEESDKEYERELSRHRVRRARIIVAVVAVVLIAAIVVSLATHKTTYDSYKVESSVRRTDAGAAQYIEIGGNLFRCSRDGVAAYSAEGEALWNSTYEVGNMSIVTGGSYFAIADLNGNDIYLFHATEGDLGSINSSDPILQVEVSAAGYIAVVVEDDGADYIHLYNMEGKHEKMYTIKKSINIDGLPLAIAVSPDGEKLVCAYTGVTGGTIDTNVVFSNFDEVGQNESERVVGGFDYGEELIGKITYLDDTHVAVVGEESLDFYRFKEYPEQVKELELEYRIDEVFTGGGHIGLTHQEEETGETVIEIYNTSGSQILTYTPGNDELTTYLVTGEQLILYGENCCRIVNLSGTVIYEGTFEDGIVAFYPLESDREYLYMNSTYIQKIRLE